MMKFSFVIPVYNAEKYLSRCLDSVLKQDFQDFEIVCINDGSKDNSMALLNEYSEKYPGKFKILSQENQGIGPARNAAFKSVSGEYTWFLDNDDCIQPNCLLSLVECLDSNKSDILNIAHVRGFFTENPFSDSFNNELNFRKISQEHALYFYEDAPWSKIYKTDFLRQNNFFFPDIFGEDTSTTFDLYSKTKNIFETKQPLYAWFERNESFSHAVISRKHFETFPLLLKKLSEQSQKCPAELKVFYENLILRKADVYISYFTENEVSEDLQDLKESCIKKSEEILKEIPDNLYFEIYNAEKNTVKIKCDERESRIRNMYERSLSWKVTRLLRFFTDIIRKRAK